MLKGDLDWIVMMALEKDRSRRYETVNGLLMDLQRYLNNEPVRARPPSQIYRLRKLARRNRAIFVSGAAVSCALILGFGTSTWLFLRERQARNEQARLLVQAQDSERITQAAISVSQGKFEEADRVLDGVRHLIRPSIDGVTAYRRVADWLALQGQWEKAGGRFSKLMEIDELDKWTIVSWDYQYCGTALAESGDLKKYAQFRKASIAHFYATTNSNEAWRIMRSCCPRTRNCSFRFDPWRLCLKMRSKTGRRARRTCCGGRFRFPFGNIATVIIKRPNSGAAARWFPATK
jgi:hypothetical protein